MQNIRFKDNDKLDLSLSGHPILIISIDEEEGYFYYLTISSSSNRTNKKTLYQHYLLKKDSENRLRAPINYVNLKNIYKSEIKGYIPNGTVNDKDFNNIMSALKNYQENYIQDENYSRILKYKKR